MSKRVKVVILILIFLIVVIGLINVFSDAKKESDEEKKINSEKIAKKNDYEIVRQSNKYTLKTEKLGDKKLLGAFYDDKNVYLYYDGKSDATLLKYNISSDKVVVLFENSEEIHGGIVQIGSNYKIRNKIFDFKFNEVGDYPLIEGDGIVLPNLEDILLSTDSGLIVKNIKDGNENLVLENKENEKYRVYSIKNDGKYLLVTKDFDDKKYMVVLDYNYKLINIFESEESDVEKSYSLLDDVPYLLEESVSFDNEVLYNIYDANSMENVFKSKSKKNYTNYIFEKTKYICNDKSGNIILNDYISDENRILINKEKKDLVAKSFSLSSDNYSLVLTLKGEEMSFYVFYL